MPFRADTLTLATSTLREAQVGALHAIVAHRSASDEPAQIVLPTGVGKTLVAVLAPYVLEAERVLVVTPARIVRDQVAYEFAELAQAIDNRALLATTPRPELLRADHRCVRETWELCRERDVVVGTPMVLSHGKVLTLSRATSSTWSFSTRLTICQRLRGRRFTSGYGTCPPSS